MSASIRTLSLAGLLLAVVSASTAAHAHAGPVADRWDHRGDRIDTRLDRRGDRIDRRLDLRGDRIDRRFDRIGQRRQGRRG
jgi:hypothetical protein